MIPIVGLLLLGSVHTSLAAESAIAEIPVSVYVHKPYYLWTATEKPTIVLKPENGAPMPAGASEQAVLTFPANGGTLTFPKIEYTEPGDYNYTMEQMPVSDPKHYWADNRKYSVRVKVFVNEEEGEHNGELYVAYSAVDETGREASIGGEGDKVRAFSFSNSIYEPCSIDPPVFKTVLDYDGKPVKDTTGTFVFRMEPIGDDPDHTPMPEETGTPKTITLKGSTSKFLAPGFDNYVYQDAEDNLSEFGRITYYDEATWKYRISEIGAPGSYSRDDEFYELTVKVTRDDNAHRYVADTTITSKKRGDIKEMEFAFTNQMIPPDGDTPSRSSGGGGGRRPRVTPPVQPEPEVLGATRDVGRGVLGAVREPQVLGAVRTGDTSAMITWAVILMLAASGIVGWFSVYQRRKRNI